MGKFKHVFVALCAMCLFSFSYNCTGGGTPDAGTDGTTPTDGVVITPDASPTDDTTTPPDTTEVKEEVVEAAPTGPIEITFDPASGEIDVDGEGSCIKVNFSIKPCSKGVTVSLRGAGDTVNTPAAFDFDPQDRAKATICPLGVLRQETEYTLTLSVIENVSKCEENGKKYNATGKYTTKAPYKNDDPADVGLSVDMRIDEITKPAGVGDLLAGLGQDGIPPILLNLHSRDDAAGTLAFVGGLGKAPPGGKPHEGKDVVDTDTPVSLALLGKFTGRAFYVGPTTFLLAVSGFTLRIDEFSLTGIFTADKKNVELAKLTGILDPEFIQAQFGLNICQLLAGECFKGPDGKDRILIAGKLTAIPNPLPFSAFITTPVYLSSNIKKDSKVTFYTISDVKKEDIKFTLSTCTGSTDEQKPCDTGKSATVTPVAGDGTITINANNKQGEYAFPAELQAATWYKLEMEAKDDQGATFKTFTVFKTE